MTELLPIYNEKDFKIIQRKDEKGNTRSELWTMRDFDKNEIMLAPCTSQLKNTHITGHAHAMVNIPKHGRGSQVDGLAMVLDGRTRTIVSKKGIVDDEEHTGSLYWLLGKQMYHQRPTCPSSR